MSSDTVTPPVSRGLIPVVTVLVIAQSYQIVAFPNFLRSLLAEPGWHLSPGGAGLIGSTVFLGILAGTAAAAPLARRFGRRPATLAAILWLTLWSGVSALATAPWQLGLLRMIAGIGMGAAYPLILSFLHDAAARANRARADVATRARRTLIFALIGMPIAGIITQTATGAVPVQHGWRLLTAMGAGLGIVVLALSARLLPAGTGTFAVNAGRAGHHKPSLRVVLAMGLGLIAVSLIAWSGFTRLSSADVRFNAVLEAGAVVALFAISGLAIRRRQTPVPNWQTVRDTLTFVMFNPATAVVIVIVVLDILGVVGTPFVVVALGVWIADGYCRAVALSMVPHVLYTSAEPTVQETGHTSPARQPPRPW
ncbi:MFS transporter [Actinoplanes subtropicus]|uniref:MFS transporter n=1 Tax=Actinoplanes subtropicus TaxID=543632 RepID=UPI0004C414D6|nr:MFS transporter [Actinoplanes subtropicus]